MIHSRTKAAPIPTEIATSPLPAELSPARVAREFRALLDDGVALRPAGEAGDDPEQLLRRGYTPKHKVELFGNVFYLTNALQNPALRFVVAYVLPPGSGRTRAIYPRIFYKDVSLIWRAVSHVVWNDEEFWIGKGDITVVTRGSEEDVFSAEETTDLPLELNAALELINRGTTNVRTDTVALELVVRNAPTGRLEAYADFTSPRRRARADRRNLVNGGRSIARFTRRDDPASLHFVRGYEPDFKSGLIEAIPSRSSMYGGVLCRYRILSRNRRVQYMFFDTNTHVWLIPAQALTTELSTFGVRTIDVIADERLYVPGFEYHYTDDESDPPELVSQIPAGFAGAQSVHDDSRADASAWIERLPVVREFRRNLPRLRAQVAVWRPSGRHRTSPRAQSEC